MAASVFTRIINRDIPSHIIYEDDVCIAFLDITPAVSGQSLVVPKQEVDYIASLDDDTYTHVFKVAKQIALASDKALGTVRTCFVVEGFEVPHAHVKLYPMPTAEEPLGTILPNGVSADAAELEAIATQITAALE